MKTSLLTALAMLALSAHGSAQVRQYVLMNKATRADFNYRAINMLDTATDALAVFRPVEGSYTVYTFVARYMGEAAAGGKKEFNDLLIIKTDNRMMIVDAYQYTLEWAERPFSSDLYRASAKGMVLQNKLRIAALKFKTAIREDRELNEEGILVR